MIKNKQSFIIKMVLAKCLMKSIYNPRYIILVFIILIPWLMIDIFCNYPEKFDRNNILDPLSNNYIPILPDTSEILSIIFKDNCFEIKWEENITFEFKSFELFESEFDNLTNAKLVYSAKNRTDTMCIIPNIQKNQFKYYQLNTIDQYLKKASSKIKRGSSYPKIVYEARTSPITNVDIFITDIDGKGNICLTPNLGTDVYPQFSPDGSKILFNSISNGQSDLYLMDIFGRDKIRLTNTSTNNYIKPKFSPDGSEIIYESDGQIYLMDSDGTSIRNITNNDWWNGSPVLLPGGARVAFRSFRGNYFDLYLMEKDGTNVEQITADENIEENICISPDGLVLVFDSIKISFFSDICYFSVLNKEIKKLTTAIQDEFCMRPFYSSDENKIYYIKNGDIYKMDLDGSGAKMILNLEGEIINFDISHENEYMVIKSFGNLYVLNLINGELLNIKSNIDPFDEYSSPIIQSTN